MTDLEEAILKRNTPGRYSKWHDYSNDECIRKSYYNEDEDSDEYDKNIDDGSTSSKEQTIPQSTVTNNVGISDDGMQQRHRTGVKGVLSDYREAKRLEKIKFENEELKRKQYFRKATEGSWMKPGEISVSIASIEQQIRLEKQNQEDSHVDDSDEDDDSFFDDDENDTSFLDSYRRMRLAEMQQNDVPQYGHVHELHGPIEFSDIIDQTDASTFCIIHLFNDDVASCRLLNEHIDKLAADKMMKFRFLKIDALILKKDFDFIGLPSVLIYKAGDEVANLTPITEMFGSARSRNGMFTLEEVECVLKQSCGINCC